MSVVLIGYTNYVLSGSVTSNNAATNFPVSNLKNNSGAPADGWQTTIRTGIVLTVTPAQTHQTFRLLGLFRTNLTSAASVVCAVYTNPSTLVWTQTLGGPVNGSAQVIANTSGVVGDYATFTINDAGNPSGFINVPLASAGSAWAPLSNLSLATSYGRDVTADEMISLGGQEYPVMRYHRRRWVIDMQNVRSTSEVWQSLDALMRAAAPGGNLLVVPDTGSATMQNEVTFGRLKQTADIKYPLGTSDRRSWTGVITERI